MADQNINQLASISTGGLGLNTKLAAWDSSAETTRSILLKQIRSHKLVLPQDKGAVGDGVDDNGQ